MIEKYYTLNKSNYNFIKNFSINNIFQLIFELNKNLFNSCNINFINSNEGILCYTLKNINSINLDNFYLKVKFSEQIINDCTFIYLENTDLETDNIQISNTLITINKNNEDLNLKFTCTIKENFYSKIVENLFKNILNKIIDNLIIFINSN